MKNCSLLLLLSCLYTMPTLGSSPKKKGDYAAAAALQPTSPRTSSDPFEDETLIPSSDLYRSVTSRKITSTKAAADELRNVYLTIVKEYNTLATRSHHAPVKFIPGKTLSDLRKHGPYIAQLLNNMEKTVAITRQRCIRRNRQENPFSAGFGKLTILGLNETILGLWKTIVFIDGLFLQEEAATSPMCNSFKDGWSYLENSYLHNAPEELKKTIHEQFVLSFSQQTSLQKAAIDEFIQTLWLSKQLVLDVYNKQLKSDTRLLKMLSWVDELPDSKFSIRSNPSALEVRNFIAHRKYFEVIIKELTKNQTDISAVKEHGACFLKDEKTGEIVALPATTAPSGSQAFKAAHSQAMAIIMNDEAKRLANGGIKDTSATELATIRSKREEIQKQIEKLSKNQYLNQKEMDRITKDLADLNTRYASLIVIAERTAVDREIQARSNRQMSLNAECSDKETGWFRSLTYATMTKNEQTPEQVLGAQTMIEAEASYQAKLAAYNEKDAAVRDMITREANTGALLTADRADTKKKETKKEEEKKQKLGKRYAEPAQAEPVEFRKPEYKTAAQCWNLQRPTLEKELKRLLSTAAFTQWQEQEREKRNKANAEEAAKLKTEEAKKTTKSATAVQSAAPTTKAAEQPKAK